MAEGSLNGDGRISGDQTAVLTFEKFDLFIDQVLGEFVPGKEKSKLVY